MSPVDRAGPDTEIMVFATEISVTPPPPPPLGGMTIFPYEHSNSGDKDETL